MGRRAGSLESALACGFDRLTGAASGWSAGGGLRAQAVPSVAGFGAALIDPDKAAGQRPESSKRKSKITIKKMIMSKRTIKRMIRFAPGIAAS